MLLLVEASKKNKNGDDEEEEENEWNYTSFFFRLYESGHEMIHEEMPCVILGIRKRRTFDLAHFRAEKNTVGGL